MDCKSWEMHENPHILEQSKHTIIQSFCSSVLSLFIQVNTYSASGIISFLSSWKFHLFLCSHLSFSFLSFSIGVCGGNVSTMLLFCCLLYDSLSASLHLFFVPSADVSFLCPNSGCFSFQFFIYFLSILLADRWGMGCLALKTLWRGLVPSHYENRLFLWYFFANRTPLWSTKWHLPGTALFSWCSEESSKMFVEKDDIGLTAWIWLLHHPHI